jgi:alpha-L-fucosidase
MNKMVRDIQPWIIFNGRNGLPGDFTTPEGHMTAPTPWRPWEACLTLNQNWCCVKEDNDWKSSSQVIDMLLNAAKGNGNLLLGIGVEADGSIPDCAKKTLLDVGDWLKFNGEAVYQTEVFDIGLMERESHRSDWNQLCDYTASGNNLYLIVKYWPWENLTIVGLKTAPLRITTLASGDVCDFDYEPNSGKLRIKNLPSDLPGMRPVFKVECASPPEICWSGGMRIPNVPHPPYDPCPSNLKN